MCEGATPHGADVRGIGHELAPERGAADPDTVVVQQILARLTDRERRRRAGGRCHMIGLPSLTRRPPAESSERLT